MNRMIGRLMVLAGVIAVAQPSLAQGMKKSNSYDVSTAGVGVITITGTPAERPGPFDWLSGENTLTLRSLVNGIEKAAADDGLRALVLKLDDAALTASQVEEIVGAIQDAQDAGKSVYVVADGYNTTGLMLAAVADESIVHHGSPVSLPGLYMEQYFLKDMFDWVGVDASFEIRGNQRPLPPGLELTGFRIVQEALTNVIRHAGRPVTARVSVSYGDANVVVEVVDDGLGAAASSSTNGTGHGLLGMSERADVYGGSVHARPRPGGGFGVTATLPIPAASTRAGGAA